jgi:hypothetical protein
MGIPNLNTETTALDQKIDAYFPPDKLAKMFQSLDSQTDFRGAGVTFLALNNDPFAGLSSVLDPSPILKFKVLRNNCRADGKTIYIREMIMPAKSTPAQAVEQAKSTLGSELTGTAISCTGAVIGWAGVMLVAGGGTVTAGAAWAAAPLATSIASAATFQCGVGIGRSINAASGNASNNDVLDGWTEFQVLMFALDAIQLADVAKTLGKNAKLYAFLRNKKFGAGGLLKSFSKMPRAARKRLAEEMLKFDHPSLRNSRKLLKQVLQGTKTLENVDKVDKVYTQMQVKKLMASTFLDILGSVATIKGSTGNVVGGVTAGAEFTQGLIIGIGQKS